MKIRKATEDDLPSIVRLLAADPLGAGREKFTDPLPNEYLRAFRAMQSRGGNHVLVAIDTGQVVGCLQLTFIAGLSRRGMTRAQIEGVRVDDTRRGQGIGEALMTSAMEQSRKQGCGLVQLTTDTSRPDAHRFYERLGFEASHTGMKMKL